MKWLEAGLEAVGKFFGWRQQQDDPETIRLKKLRDIDSLIEKEKSEINKLLNETVTDENKDLNALNLGFSVNKLLSLRREREKYQR